MINRNLVSRLNKASLELLNNSNERICDDTGVKKHIHKDTISEIMQFGFEYSEVLELIELRYRTILNLIQTDVIVNCTINNVLVKLVNDNYFKEEAIQLMNAGLHRIEQDFAEDLKPLTYYNAFMFLLLICSILTLFAMLIHQQYTILWLTFLLGILPIYWIVGLFSCYKRYRKFKLNLKQIRLSNNQTF